MTIILDGTLGISAPVVTTPGASINTNISYTGTLTGGTGVVNIGSGQVYKDAAGNLGIGTASPSAVARASFGNSSASTPALWATFFGTNSGGAAAAPNFGLTFGWNKSNGGGESNIVYGTGAGSATGLAFASSDGTTVIEKMRLDASGNLLVGGAFLSAPGVAISGTGTYIAINNNASATGAVFQSFRRSATEVGSITQSGTTAVLYNTSSDYRLKEVIGAVSGAGDRIDALQPIEYTWKADGSHTRGFLAHKFQEVYPGSVSGEKDAVDADGKPKYQAMQASTPEVIADLVAELQSLRKRITILENK
jgi:hypothetical protein